MGRKKYYCDFCSRFFNDDKNVRIKHLNSVGHLKAKTEHYDLFKDPEIILQENSIKKPCRRFQNDGYCPFGNSCTYSHYTYHELDLIRQEIYRLKLEKYSLNIPDPEVLCQKYNEIRQRRSPRHKTQIWSHELPTNLLPLAETLPPSLQPFNVKIYEDIQLDNWG